MGARGTLLRFLASSWCPQPLTRWLVRAFAVWWARHLARADRQAQPGIVAEGLDSSIYLLDGYHGGMPFWDWLLLPEGGLWRHLLWPAVGEVLVRRAREAHLPAVLDLDGYTFAVMSAEQPEALSRLKAVMAAGTIEVVNGTYSQPFLRTLSGEAVIRQFVHGLAAIESALGVSVTSYASQEPCFCAQLPQILAGFGYKQALVRTHWAPFGDEPGHDACLVRWVGPDGSVVLAVPRYTWMEYETRRDLYPGLLRGNLTGAHASQWTGGDLRCFGACAAAHHREPPLISKLEDLTPLESPTLTVPVLASNPSIHLTSLSGYCDTMLARPASGSVASCQAEPYHDRGPAEAARPELPVWQPAADDFSLTLPWGLQGDALIKARDQAEAALLVAERVDAMAYICGGPTFEAELSAAWQRLLLAQHHDLHVCGPWLSRAHGKPMLEAGCELCNAAEQQAVEVRRAALSHLLGRLDTSQVLGRPVLVVNPEARARRAVVHLSVAGRVFDGGHALPTQDTEEGVVFLCDLPALGYRVFDLREIPRARARRSIPPPRAESGAALEFHNAFYHASLEERGTLSLSAHGRTLLARGATLGTWCEGQWWASSDSSAGTLDGGGLSCDVLADGPVFVRWRVRGPLGRAGRGQHALAFEQDMTLYRELPRLDLAVTLDAPGAWFGPQPDDGDGYYALDERKLCVCFPVAAMEARRVVRQVPFFIEETCRPRFIGDDWVGVEGDGLGLAVLARGARGYAYDQETGLLRRVLAWSPRAWNYASDDSVTPGGSRYTTLRGQHSFHYALLPFCCRTEVVAEAAHYRLSAPAVVGWPSAGDLPPRGSLLRIDADGVELTAFFVCGDAVYARLWNASAIRREVTLYPAEGLAPAAVDLRLEHGSRLNGGRLSLRPWGVQTVRLAR